MYKERMTLAEYLKSSERRLTDFANACDTSPGYMHDLVHGRRTPSLPLALTIVAESEGHVDIASMLPAQK